MHAHRNGRDILGIRYLYTATGGMFVWITLPDGCSSQAVFDAALQEQVAVLPGTPFYIDGGGENTIRLNFSNSTNEKIITGVQRLALVIKKQCRN